MGALALIAEELGEGFTIVSGDLGCLQVVTDSVESFIERVGELPAGRIKNNIKENADKVRIGKRMVTIVRDVPVELDLERSRWTRYDYDRVRTVFDRFEFRQLLS